MDTSRIEEVKPPQHDGTPGSYGVFLEFELLASRVAVPES